LFSQRSVTLFGLMAAALAVMAIAQVEKGFDDLKD